MNPDDPTLDSAHPRAGLASALRESCTQGLNCALRITELLWRCVFPALASAFLIYFFCNTSQGSELLKIFIAGERTLVQYWSIAMGFGLACLSIWWVSRRILLMPWPHVRKELPPDVVAMGWVNGLPALLALGPMVLLTREIHAIDRATRSISASRCITDSSGVCRGLDAWVRPDQGYLFALFTALLLLVIVKWRPSRMRESTRLAPVVVIDELRWIGALLAIAFCLWFVFLWSGSSAGEISTATFYRHQMMAQRFMGSVTITLIGVASWTIFGGLLLTLHAKRLLRISLVGLPWLMMIVSSFFRHDDNNLRRLTPLPAAQKAPSVTASLTTFHARALAKRSDKNATDDVPIYLVSAAGGGLRAAYWSAAVLGDLQDAHPDFADHTFLISGVSGGGLGAATFIAGLRAGCPPPSTGAFLGDCMRRVLEDVPLSPVLASTLYSDFWRSLWPSSWHDFAWKTGFSWWLGENSDRAHTLEHTWETSFAWCAPNPEKQHHSGETTNAARPFRCAKRPWTATADPTTIASNIFGRSFAALWADRKPDQWLPNLIINGTDAATARRILSSNLALRPAEFPDAYIARTDDPGILNLRVSTVVHNGARFPVVSPAGRISNSGLQKEVMQPWSPNAQGDDLSTITAGAAIARSARLMCSQLADGRGVNPCRLPGQDVHQILDGGYFDNSGMETISDVIDEISAFNDTLKPEQPKLRAAVIIIVNSGWSYAVPSGSKASAIDAIVSAYTQAVDAKAAHMLADRINRTTDDAQEDTFLFNLDRSGHDVPGLGWALSEASTNQMIIASAHPLYDERIEDTLKRLPISPTMLKAKIQRQERCQAALAGTLAIAAKVSPCGVARTPVTP